MPPQRQVNSDASTLLPVFPSKSLNIQDFKIWVSCPLEISFDNKHCLSPLSNALFFCGPQWDYRSSPGKCIGNIYSPLSAVNLSGNPCKGFHPAKSQAAEFSVAEQSCEDFLTRTQVDDNGEKMWNVFIYPIWYIQFNMVSDKCCKDFWPGHQWRTMVKRCKKYIL